MRRSEFDRPLWLDFPIGRWPVVALLLGWAKLAIEWARGPLLAITQVVASRALGHRSDFCGPAWPMLGVIEIPAVHHFMTFAS